MKKKLMYEVPDVELIELKLEGYLMQSGGFSSKGTELMDEEKEEEF